MSVRHSSSRLNVEDNAGMAAVLAHIVFSTWFISHFFLAHTTHAVPINRDAGIERLWRHLEETSPSQVDFSGFGQRLTSIKRHAQLAVSRDDGKPSSVEATTRLLRITQQLLPKPDRVASDIVDDEDITSKSTTQDGRQNEPPRREAEKELAVPMNAEETLGSSTVDTGNTTRANVSRAEVADILGSDSRSVLSVVNATEPLLINVVVNETSAIIPTESIAVVALPEEPRTEAVSDVATLEPNGNDTAATLPIEVADTTLASDTFSSVADGANVMLADDGRLIVANVTGIASNVTEATSEATLVSSTTEQVASTTNGRLAKEATVTKQVATETKHAKLPDSGNVKLVLNAEILREQTRLRYRSNATANYLTLLKTRQLSKLAANKTDVLSTTTTTAASTTTSTTSTTTTTEGTEPAWRRRVAASRRKPPGANSTLASEISTETTSLANSIAPTEMTPTVEPTTVATVAPSVTTTSAADDNTLETLTSSTSRSTYNQSYLVLEPSISELTPASTLPSLLPQTTMELTAPTRPLQKTIYSTITRPSRTTSRFFYTTPTTFTKETKQWDQTSVTIGRTSSVVTPATSLVAPQLDPATVPAILEEATEALTTSTTTSTTTTTTTAKPPATSHRSLEDILRRLVPAPDDNPFLSSVPRVNHVLLSSRNGDYNHLHNKTSDLVLENSTSTTDSTDEKTTSLYIVGIVAIFPIAGVLLWLVRTKFTKKGSRLNESESSSETDIRKLRGLPPLPVTPSKQNKLFYGINDKDCLAVTRSSPWEYSRSRLRLQTLIGEGNFGQVWKAEAQDICGCQGTLLVAVKTVKDGATAKDKQELLREMKIMQQLGPHPNVVALLGCCTEQEPFFLIMEYVMYGKLLAFLRDHRSQQSYYNYSSDSEALTSRDLTTFAYCVAKGMEYIASKGIVHRDLAARNVLVDHNKLCKVADFGLSRSVRDSGGEMYEQRVKGALPIRWMAPESLIQSIFTQKSDVWSFGILMWEIVTLGSTPYPGMEAREVMRRVKDGYRLDRPNHCRPELFRLMSRCWHSDPGRRPDFSELKSELSRLLDDSQGYVDLDKFQDSIYLPLNSPSDESEKV